MLLIYDLLAIDYVYLYPVHSEYSRHYLKKTERISCPSVVYPGSFL